MSKQPHISFETIEKMSAQELKKLISNHPEMIPTLAHELLKTRPTKRVPKVTKKIIQCITNDEIMRSESVERLFKILELNNFLGLDRNKLLSDALAHKNYVLATKLIEHGAIIDESIPAELVADVMKGLINAGPFHLFNACIDYFLRFHEEEFEGRQGALSGIFELAFNDPLLSDCKIEIKRSDGKVEEIWVNTKLLKLSQSEQIPTEEIMIEPTDEKPDVLIDLLRYCYHGKVKIDQNNVKDLLIASHHYKVPSMHDKCEQWITDHLDMMESEQLLDLGRSGGSSILLDTGYAMGLTLITDPESYLKQHGKEIEGLNCFFWNRELFHLFPLIGKYCPKLQRLILPTSFEESDLPLLSHCKNLRMIEIPQGASIFSQAIEKSFPHAHIHAL